MMGPVIPVRFTIITECVLGLACFHYYERAHVIKLNLSEKNVSERKPLLSERTSRWRSSHRLARVQEEIYP